MGRRINWATRVREELTTIALRRSVFHKLEVLKETLKNKGVNVHGTHWNDLVELLVDTWNNIPECQYVSEGWKLGPYPLTWGQVVTDVFVALTLKHIDLEPVKVSELAEKTGYTWQQVRTALSLMEKNDHNVKFLGGKPKSLWVAYIGRNGEYEPKKGERGYEEWCKVQEEVKSK